MERPSEDQAISGRGAHQLMGLVWLTLAVGFAAWVGAGVVSAWLAPEAPSVGARPPPLEVETLDGRRFELDGLGRVAVIDFWRPDCVGCVGQTPILNRVYDRFRDRIEVVAVSDAEAPAVARFVADRDVRYPVALDTAEWTRRFGVIAYPTLVVVDAEGRVSTIHKRGATEERLIRDVEKLLAGRDP